MNAEQIIETALDAWTRDMIAGRVVRTPANVAADALMAGHCDVHLHRNPDGTVSVTPMRSTSQRWSNARLLVWVDVEAGAS